MQRANVLGDDVDVIDAIFTTRAQRRLRTDPVPEWVIWEVLDAAIRGPSSGNYQRWAWIVVTDTATKEAIGQWYLEAWESLSRGRRARLKQLVRRVLPVGTLGAETGPPLDDPNYASGDHLAHHIAEAPVWIFAVLNGIKGEPSVVDGADIFGAVQNLMLAARRFGVGGTLTMLHRRRENDVAELLGLPPGARPLALIPLGYPQSGRFGSARRQPVETVTHWGRWGAIRTRPSLHVSPAESQSAALRAARTSGRLQM